MWCGGLGGSVVCMEGTVRRILRGFWVGWVLLSGKDCGMVVVCCVLGWKQGDMS